LWPTPSSLDERPSTPAATAEPRFVRDAVIAHAVFVPETRHPVEVAASDEAHLVQWLTRRLGTPVKAPVLQSQGFRLLGGRLLPGADAPRAQFMYEDTQGHRLTLYVTVFGEGQSPQETAFRSVREGSVEAFYWIEGRLGYALSADLPAADVMALARSVYLQLTP
jgi:anti-sigma factor RsiW